MARKKKLTAGRLAKLTRVAVSVIMLVLTTLMFTVLSARVALGLGWIARVQIFPLALAGAFSSLALWVSVTLIFGRLYCSFVCPMGALQDVFSRLRRFTRRRRFRLGFRYAAPQNKLRYALLFMVVAAVLLGATLAVTLLDPYSAFGRIATEIIRPVVQWIGGEKVLVASWLAFSVAAATLLLVAGAAWWRGRLVCNTICPVGSLLSCVSRYSLMHFDIDTDVCINCHKCERTCKAQCINTQDHVVDGSRCVMCFNCVDACEEGAIKYTFRHKKLSIPMMQKIEQQGDVALRIDRRKFMATGLILAAAPLVEAADKTIKRIQPYNLRQKPLPASHAVTPPGRLTMRDFLLRCTGCGLCVAHCPNHVIRPAKGELGAMYALHPVMHYDESYCLYNCTRCTNLCPTGALKPLTTEEKHEFVIGRAFTDEANCIGCGLCVRRCPRQAVSMVPRKEYRRGLSTVVAKVDTDMCIGCGACQYICPATPVKAIGVEGMT